MARLKDNDAKKIINNWKKSLNVSGSEVYECDKGDGNLIMVGPEESLQDHGWTINKGPKGTFYYCPNHKKQFPPKKDITEDSND